ncbi:MAG: DUF819 family protein [Bacteroidetes bacterium]|nr:DUF819 family protein [Bacteroidota bacterium]
MPSVLLYITYTLFPVLVLYLASRSKIISSIGPVVICYATGVLLANLGLLKIENDTAEIVSGVAIFLAIPLLLFSTDFIKWIRQSKKSLLSFLFCLLSVMCISTCAFFFFQNRLDDTAILSGMMVGIYTGGASNMAAIGAALDIRDEVFVLMTSCDVLLGGLYFLFIITFAKKVFKLALPSYPRTAAQHDTNDQSEELSKFSWKKNANQVLICLIVAVLILGIAFGIAYSIDHTFPPIIIILGITTLGIGASFIKQIRNLKGSFELGDYFMLVFCVALGSLANFEVLLETGTEYLKFVGFILLGSVSLHFFLAYLFKIDVDTFIITSTAALYGAPFIGPVAKVLNNRAVIVVGITTSLIGYALGNYLGLLLAFLLG